MAYYRLYNLSPSSGHIDRVEEFDAADDRAAIEHVEGLERAVAVELWQEGRKILHLDGPTNIALPGEPLAMRDAVAA